MIEPDEIPDPTAQPGEPESAETRVPVEGACEYRAPDNAHWRCEEAARLQADFRIPAKDMERKLREWHALFSAVPQTWVILRRTYGVAPLLGSSFEDMRTWLDGEIAEEQHISIAELRSHLAEAQQHWARAQLTGDLAKRMATAKPQLSPDEAQTTLARYGFGQLTQEDDKAYVLNRIMELGHLLELDTGRPLAVQAIFQELMLKKTMAGVLTEASKGSGSSYTKKMEEYSKQQSNYEETMKKLGATQEQNPGFRRKVAFSDCISQIAAGIQAYYERSDTALIDGLFTEAEIILLLTPLPLRPPQYRPDIVLLSIEWRKYLWDPNYEGGKFDGRITRNLLAMFQASVEAAAAGADASLPADARDAEMEEVDDALDLKADGVDSELPDGSDGAAGNAPSAPPRRSAGEDVAVF